MIFRFLSAAGATALLSFAPALAQEQTNTAQPDTAPAQQTAPVEQSTTAPSATTSSTTAPSAPTEATTQSPPAAEGQTAQADSAEAVVLATPADVKVGAVVNDQTGQNVGRIESVTAEGAVIATDKVKAQVPLSSFGKKGDTLVVGISKAEFEAAVANSTPPPAS